MLIAVAMAPGAISPDRYAITGQLELHAIEYTAHVVCGHITHLAIHTDPRQLLALYNSLVAPSEPSQQPAPDAPLGHGSPSHRWADKLSRHDQHVSTMFPTP